MSAEGPSGARRRKSMPTSALVQLDENGTNLPEKRSGHLRTPNKSHRSEKRRRASVI